MHYHIEVGYKDGILDAHGESVHKDISDLGVHSVNKVKSLQTYSLETNLPLSDMQILSERLLIDPITQQYTINTPLKPQGQKHFIIEVSFKKGVTDAVADTVVTGMKDLGLPNDGVTVHTGTKYILFGHLSKQQAETIAAKLLANTIVQDYKITYE